MSDEHLYNHIYLSPLIKPTKEQRELCRPYEDIYMSHCKQSVVESHLKSELLCGNARRSLKKCLETDHIVSSCILQTIEVVEHPL
jgi:hypothetical protein